MEKKTAAEICHDLCHDNIELDDMPCSLVIIDGDYSKVDQNEQDHLHFENVPWMFAEELIRLCFFHGYKVMVSVSPDFEGFEKAVNYHLCED